MAGYAGAGGGGKVQTLVGEGGVGSEGGERDAELCPIYWRPKPKKKYNKPYYHNMLTRKQIQQRRDLLGPKPPGSKNRTILLKQAIKWWFSKPENNFKGIKEPRIKKEVKKAAPVLTEAEQKEAALKAAIIRKKQIEDEKPAWQKRKERKEAKIKAKGPEAWAKKLKEKEAWEKWKVENTKKKRAAKKKFDDE